MVSRVFVVGGVLCAAATAAAAPPAHEYSNVYMTIGSWRGPKAMGGEPPAGAAVDVLAMTCNVARNHKLARCEADTRGLDTDRLRRLGACFRATPRAPTRSELHAMEARVLGDATAIAATTPPREFLVQLTTHREIDEVVGRGCEGVHDQPCDMITVPTGKKIWTDDIAAMLYGPTGEAFARGGPAAYKINEVYWVEIKDSHFEIPQGESATPEAWQRAYLTRLESFEVPPDDLSLRGVVAYDREALALALHEPERLRSAALLMHAVLDEAKRQHVQRPPEMVYNIDIVVQLADAVLSGEAVTVDPCRPQP